MATQVERNARLDLLKAATVQWADKEEQRLQTEAARLRTVLRGRTGAERVTRTTVAASEAFAVREIEQFLTGEI